MKKIVLEIDGVRHRLVEGDMKTSCSHCSIQEFCECVFFRMCDFPGYVSTRCNYVEEKDSDLGSPLKVDFDD